MAAASPIVRVRFLVSLGIAVTTIALVVYGWSLFWFLTDDSYITFRYISNSLAGRGLVWNPAPFRPVEGYTSFLWVILLREVWRFTSIAPPDSANVIALCSGLATLYLGARFLMRMRLPSSIERWRLLLVALVMIGTVTNRTFLAWLSSGLETALFNFLFTWWLYESMARDRRGTLPWTLRLTSSAALCALCRPDGLLLVAATAAILLIERPRWPATAGATPLLIVPTYLLWRHSFYGEWLPNTYYAKYTAPWPEAGWRYLGSFILEYGIWWWLILGALRVLTGWKKGRRSPNLRDLGMAIPVATLVAHLAYYTLIIGGDHFEYRVYSHLILLLFVSAVWLVSGLTSRMGVATALVAGFVVVSEPIPWTHWERTRGFTTLAQGGAISIADAFPPIFRPVVAQWDAWQAWLEGHLICVRQHEHRIVWQTRIAENTTRDVGENIPWSDRHTYPAFCVGVTGWTLPNVAILDNYGLNDRVIARTHTGDGVRLMAHERAPPPGYFACFHPDVSVEKGKITLMPRKHPLTDDDIRACENHPWPRLGAASQPVSRLGQPNGS